MTDQRSVTEDAAELWALAIAIFGGEDGQAFRDTPHPMLNDHTPGEASAERTGRAEVERILRALEHGLPV
jgi:uncharacterized protein (DUF2384 family)